RSGNSRRLSHRDRRRARRRPRGPARNDPRRRSDGPARSRQTGGAIVMSASEKYNIHGDSRSGNCLKVRWTMLLLGFPFEWVETDIVSSSTPMEEFLKLKWAGQVPCVILPDGRGLALSTALIAHITQVHH